VLDSDEPNLAWFIFADQRARAAYPDWDDIADELVANLHQLRHGDTDTDTDTLVARLSHTAGQAFTDRWERRPLGARRSGVKALSHPDAGLLRLAFETLELPDPDQRLIVYLPADAATAAGLDRLAGRRPGALRAVRSG